MKTVDSLSLIAAPENMICSSFLLELLDWSLLAPISISTSVLISKQSPNPVHGAQIRVPMETSATRLSGQSPGGRGSGSSSRVFVLSRAPVWWNSCHASRAGPRRSHLGSSWTGSLCESPQVIVCAAAPESSPSHFRTRARALPRSGVSLRENCWRDTSAVTRRLCERLSSAALNKASLPARARWCLRADTHQILKCVAH